MEAFKVGDSVRKKGDKYYGTLGALIGPKTYGRIDYILDVNLWLQVEEIEKFSWFNIKLQPIEDWSVTIPDPISNYVIVNAAGFDREGGYTLNE